MKKILFLSIVSISALADQNSKIYPWSSPDWGFVRPQSQEISRVQTTQLKNSLIFDQPFDPNPVLPAQPAIEKSTPAVVAKTFKQIPRPQPVTVEFKKTISIPFPELPAKPAAIDKPAPTQVAKAEIKTPVNSAQSQVVLGSIIEKPWTRASIEQAHLRIVDEETLNLNEPRGVSGVEVFWFGTESGIKTVSNSKGIALVPKFVTHSARFIAKAPGYMPAVGYSIGEMVTPVVMHR